MSTTSFLNSNSMMSVSSCWSMGQRVSTLVLVVISPCAGFYLAWSHVQSLALSTSYMLATKHKAFARHVKKS